MSKQLNDYDITKSIICSIYPIYDITKSIICSIYQTASSRNPWPHDLLQAAAASSAMSTCGSNARQPNHVIGV
jgi:hypothetical protein